MAKKEMEALRSQLMSRIDESDLHEVKKVHNLIRLYELDALCDESINENGVSVVTKNATQHFVKSHPSIGEKLKINAQIIALEKSIKFKLKVEDSATTQSVEDKDKREGLL